MFEKELCVKKYRILLNSKKGMCTLNLSVKVEKKELEKNNFYTKLAEGKNK